MKISGEIPTGVKKWLLMVAVIVSFCPVFPNAQEVITDKEGRKIVVEPNGNWRYFQADSSTDTLKFKVTATATIDRAKYIEATKLEEQGLNLALIKKRVEMTDLKVELLTTSDNLLNKKAQLKLLQQKVGELETALEDVKQRLIFLEKINQLPDEVYGRKLKKWENDHPIVQAKTKNIGKETVKPTVRPPVNISNGILIAPPSMPCNTVSKNVDPVTKQVQWENKPSRLFSHTDKAIEAQFGKRDFVDCMCYLSAKEGGMKFLNLEIAVASVKAPQIFGSLPKDEFLEILLLNGEKIRLFNIFPSSGQWVGAQDAYLYVGRYALGIKEEKLLTSIEVDKILVRWSLVQEEFEIYETDFFQVQFACLEDILIKEN